MLYDSDDHYDNTPYEPKVRLDGDAAAFSVKLFLNVKPERARDILKVILHAKERGYQFQESGDPLWAFYKTLETALPKKGGVASSPYQLRVEIEVNVGMLADLYDIFEYAKQYKYEGFTDDLLTFYDMLKWYAKKYDSPEQTGTKPR